METALWLLAIQGALGAFDTLYYHEYRARLPAGGLQTRPELVLHGVRDLIYAVVFASLPFVAWAGSFAWILGALLLAEIAITLADFVVEDRVRRPLGGVFPGERVMHAVMGIVYGAMLSRLVPALVGWASRPSGFEAVSYEVPAFLTWLLPAMAAGVFASGVRDLAAASGVSVARWPWAGAPAAGVSK